MRKLQIVIIGVALAAASRVEAGSCSWRTNPTNVVFGTYSPFGSGTLSATSSYEFRCTPNTEGILTFSRGSSSTYFPRYMSSGGNLIGYNLYDDAAATTVVGDGSGGTTRRVVFNGTPQNKDFADTIYATTPLGTDVPVGTYVDTIIATLSWDNFARSLSVSFTVTTTVQPECRVTTAAVDFGDYDPVVANLATPKDGTGAIDVYCTRGTSATVSLGNGLNFVAGSRRMAGPAASMLSYQLYRNAARTQLWSVAPNTMSGTSTSRLTPINGGLTVYGRIPGGQNPVVGRHNDTVQATVNY